MLRSRTSRREDPLEERVRLPDPIISSADGVNPEHEALLADSVGLALLVVLEALAPAERPAFVLHDLFAVPFEEIAPVVGRTPAAARQLGSRARRRVQGAAPTPEPDVAKQREVVDAFLAATRDGDFDALVALLDPDIEVRSDGGPLQPGRLVRRPSRAGRSTRPGSPGRHGPALVNGTPGVVATAQGRPVSVLAFTVTAGRIVSIAILNDPERLARLDLTVLDD